MQFILLLSGEHCYEKERRVEEVMRGFKASVTGLHFEILIHLTIGMILNDLFEDGRA